MRTLLSILLGLMLATSMVVVVAYATPLMQPAQYSGTPGYPYPYYCYISPPNPYYYYPNNPLYYYYLTTCSGHGPGDHHAKT